MPSPIRLLSLCALVALSASSAEAQIGLESASSSVSLTAYMPATLSVVSTGVMAVDTSSTHVTVTVRVETRGNVGHRLAVRSAGASQAEVQGARGQWTSVSQGVRVEAVETRATGDVSHTIKCRVSVDAARSGAAAAGCGLVYELESTNPEFPTRTAAAPAAIQTASLR